MWEAADLSLWQTQDATWMKIKRLHIDSRFLFQNPLDPIYIAFFLQTKIGPWEIDPAESSTCAVSIFCDIVA